MRHFDFSKRVTKAANKMIPAVNNRLFNLLIGLSRATENKNKKDTFDLNATIELSCAHFKCEWKVVKRFHVQSASS